MDMLGYGPDTRDCRKKSSQLVATWGTGI